MMFEFSPLGVLIALSWFLCGPIEAIPSVVVAVLVFCSRSVPVSLLLLLLLQVFAFFQANLGTRRDTSGITQRRFMMVFAGGFTAVFGAALGGERWGHLLEFFGLLIMIPNGVTTFFFSRFYERLTLKSFMGSVVIPAYVGINILLKIRSEVRVDFAPLWDYSVIGLGGLTLIFAAGLSFLRMRIKRVLIYWSQAWIGVALFLLGAEVEHLSEITFASLAIFGLSSASLLSLGAQAGPRHFAFARMSCLGLPGLIGFSAILFSLKIALNMNGLGMGLVLGGYLILATTLIACRPGQESVPNKKVKLGFWLVTAVQTVSGCGLIWMAAGALK